MKANEYKKACQACWHNNHKDNFLCENCGFDFDLQIDINDFGLPEIKIKQIMIELGCAMFLLGLFLYLTGE